MLTLDANFEISNCFTVVVLLIYVASASKHRSRRGGASIAYTDPFGERQ